MITLEQAIEFENKSIAIYESLASKVSLPGLKSLFNSIAHEGQYHLDMISSITNNSEICIIHHPDIEDLSIIFEGIMDNGKALLDLPKEIVNGCHLAMLNEDSLLSCYEDLLVKEEKEITRGLFSKIIEQEKSHLSVMKDLCILVSEQQSAL